MLADRIIYEDGEALVIDKPAGLAVHPGPSTPRSLEDHLDELRLGFRRAPTPVHRLDRDTSGCLLLARNPKAHKRFAAEFEAGRVTKTYLAVLDGVPEQREGVIDMPLAKISSREAGWRMVADAKGQRAVTHWALVGEARGRALIRFTPETGRTHQLRVHAASGIGVPILGDPVYGRQRGEAAFRMLLHAASLRLERAGKSPIEAAAPLPASFANAGFDDGGL
jgi:tRNA pseudouridine32 synthase/23S rRNA pseudouridine746 synthase